jgi:hypothetical protein
VNLTLMATVLWAAGFILNAALLFVLVFKRRYRLVPWFTAWIAFGCLYTITLFLGYRLGSKHLYAVLYWSGAFLDLLLQVGVVLEIARRVLKRSGRWVEGARVRLVAVGVLAPLIALGMAWTMTPAAQTRLDAWDARASLFTTILICLMFAAVTLASQQLGVAWRSHIMRESYGLVLWTLVAFLTDTLHAYWRTLGHFTLLENVRIVFFQASLIYWAIAFWRPEAAPVVMPENAMLELDRLVSRVEYAQSNREPPTTGVSPK